MEACQCNREENDMESAQSKSSAKRKLIRDRYKLLPPCSCKKRCIEKINDEQRKMIHQEFWSLESYDERRNLIFGLVKRLQKTNSTVSVTCQVKSPPVHQKLLIQCK